MLRCYVVEVKWLTGSNRILSPTGVYLHYSCAVNAFLKTKFLDQLQTFVTYRPNKHWKKVRTWNYFTKCTMEFYMLLVSAVKNSAHILPPKLNKLDWQRATDVKRRIALRVGKRWIAWALHSGQFRTVMSKELFKNGSLKPAIVHSPR